MADYDVFNIEEKWFGEAEPVNYEAGVQDGVPTRTPTIILDEDNGAVHVCNTPNPTIRNTGWTKYSTGGTPVDSDIFTVTFDIDASANMENPDNIPFTTETTYEELLAAIEDGKKIKAVIGFGQAGSGVGLDGFITEHDETRSYFQSYQFAGEPGGTVLVCVAITWDTEEEIPIVGNMYEVEIPTEEPTEVLITADVIYTADDGFWVGNVRNQDNEEVNNFEVLTRYIADGSGVTPKLPMRMLAHVVNNDAPLINNFNNYTELKFTQYDTLNNVITFENHTFSSGQIIFTKISAIKGDNNTISWNWDQAYLSAN